jgi:hypothetical protein
LCQQISILHQGWNPLNYVLLNLPSIVALKEVFEESSSASTVEAETVTANNSTITNESQSTLQVFPTIQISKSGKVVAKYLDVVAKYLDVVAKYLDVVAKYLDVVAKYLDVVSKYLDHLIAISQASDEGRKRKYNELQTKKDNNQRIDLLKDITKISSGKL